MRAHIQKNQIPTRRSGKKRLLKILTSRLFIVAVLILLQLFLLLFALVELGTRQYWVSIAFKILSFLMVLCILPREDNPSYKISWIILIMAVPLVGGIFYLIFGMKRNSRHMARQIERYTRTLLHRDHGQQLLAPKAASAPLNRLEQNNPMLGRQAGYIQNSSGFMLYENTEAQYFPSGETFYERLLEELRGAKKFILLEYFIVHPGKMWDSILKILEQKRDHGVQIRIMYDDVGCVTTLPALYADYLRQKGFQVGVFNPFHPQLNAATNYRDHRKICVIDGNVGFTGGINLADEYINEKVRFGYWRDTGVRLRGPAAWSFTTMFLEFWAANRPKTDERAVPRPAFPAGERAGDCLVQPFCDSPVDDECIAKNVYLELINQAERELLITTPYLIADSDLITALKLAAKRGVDVRIYTPGIPDKWYVYWVTQSYYRVLLEAGVRIFEYTPGFIHAKMYVSDDKTAIVGSANMDYRSLYLHFENCCAFYGGQMVQDVRADLEECMSVSNEVFLEDTYKTPLPKRVAQLVLRLFAPLL